MFSPRYVDARDTKKELAVGVSKLQILFRRRFRFGYKERETVEAIYLYSGCSLFLGTEGLVVDFGAIICFLLVKCIYSASLAVFLLSIVRGMMMVGWCCWKLDRRANNNIEERFALLVFFLQNFVSLRFKAIVVYVWSKETADLISFLVSHLYSV